MEHRIRVLDGWRGASILVVLSAHLAVSRFRWVLEDGSFQDPRRPVLMLKAAVWRLSETGGLFGVSMFFVISGFIITTLLIEEERRHGRVSLPAFYLRRAFRILPALLAYLAAIAALTWQGALDVEPVTLLRAAGFACNIGGGCGWYVGHLWTLAVEEQFYIAWPALFVLLGARRRAAAYGVAAVAFVLAGWGGLDAGGRNGVAAACIALGVVLAIDVQARHRIEAAASPVAVCLALLVCASHGFVPGSTPQAHLVLFLFPLAVTLIFCAALRPNTRLHRMVSAPVLGALGLLSYSIYLWQQLFMGERQPVLLLPFFAIASFVLIERPCLRLGRAFVARLRVPDPPGRSASTT